MSKYNAQSGIYVISNIKNGKIYLGQAVDISHRWHEHQTTLKGGYHRNKHLQNAYDKFGDKAFKFKVLEYCAIEKLDEREQHYLDIYTPKGICYNIAVDATSPMRGRKASLETRLKMSEAQKGRKHSEETLKLLSKINSNRSDETRKKLSEVNKGKYFSEETRRKIGEASRNRPPASEETRHKISEANRNRSAEVRHKISEGNKGKVLSAETRRKLSEVAKLREARKRLERTRDEE